jgi:hypothetical protein
LSLSASASYKNEHQPVALLRYLDVALVVIAAPIMLLIGVPASGYLAGAGSWIVLRALGVGVERYAGSAAEVGREVTIRLAYLMARLFLLALTVIIVRNDSGKDAALTALLVIVFAFTVQLALSFTTRPTPRRRQ